MAMIQRFEDLEIWKLARVIFHKISKIADKMRRNHDFRFAEQIKSAAGSVMDNIAEGFERNSRLEFLNSLSISKGECGELKSQLYRALDNLYVTTPEFDELYGDLDVEIKKLSSFIAYLNRTTIKGLKFKGRAKSP